MEAYQACLLKEKLIDRTLIKAFIYLLLHTKASWPSG